ncbi:alcohol dehydrogenase [Clostridium novyi A str. 4552]|uniref:Alcohol dehydrogenase n=1 Tax=Clostridium novyi A str. 4552 TaxID=1444289 RepID=A0A0A0IBX9_CLONO|nr:iron-containing alcohol dehydrogenase [Clostridium novyi]KGM97846.1 alcohol dehydrogenase [Clostridium novyi A str. 4552]
MKNFNYNNPAKIIFGDGAEKEIENLLKEYKTSSLLLVYSGDFIKDLGIWDTVHDACIKLGIEFYEEGNVVPNPKIELVRNLVGLGKEKSVDFILAVGGGSSIDTAKAVSVGIPYTGDVWDFFEGISEIEQAIPVGVITTLPSSGSETSNCSIISNGLFKVGIEHDLIIPKFAIMNPTFTINLPAYQTSCGIADILSHLLERYFTDVENVDTTDFLIEGAIKSLLLNASRLMLTPSDYNARAEIQWLASIAHNNLLDTGRIADWGSHRIEHELSAQYGITHGEGMSIIFIAWTKYMVEYKPKKLAQLANRIFNIDYHDYTEKQMALELSNHLKQFFMSLNLKTSLTELNINNTYFEEMALRATNNNSSTVGHYIPLDKPKIVSILNLAL